jgi:hypothetical protein
MAYADVCVCWYILTQILLAENADTLAAAKVAGIPTVSSDALLRVSIRQHISAYVAYVSISQHTSAYEFPQFQATRCCGYTHTSAYLSIRQHTSAFVSIRRHTSAYLGIRQHTSAYVSIRQHTSVGEVLRKLVSLFSDSSAPSLYISLYIYIYIYICIAYYVYNILFILCIYIYII